MVNVRDRDLALLALRHLGQRPAAIPPQCPDPQQQPPVVEEQKGNEAKDEGVPVLPTAAAAAPTVVQPPTTLPPTMSPVAPTTQPTPQPEPEPRFESHSEPLVAKPDSLPHSASPQPVGDSEAPQIPPEAPGVEQEAAREVPAQPQPAVKVQVAEQKADGPAPVEEEAFYEAEAQESDLPQEFQRIVGLSEDEKTDFVSWRRCDSLSSDLFLCHVLFLCLDPSQDGGWPCHSSLARGLTFRLLGHGRIGSCSLPADEPVPVAAAAASFRL